MDYGAFGKTKELLSLPKQPVTVQIVDVTGPNDFVLWDGVRDLAAKYIPSENEPELTEKSRWAVIRITEQKSFGAKYTVKAFTVTQTPSRKSIRLAVSAPDNNAPDTTSNTGTPIPIDQLTAKPAQNVELVIMAISKIAVVKTQDKPGKPGGTKEIIRLMLADSTGSVNATAWEGNLKKLEGAVPGQLLHISNAFIKLENPNYQYAATSSYHVTITDTSEVTIKIYWPPWFELTSLRLGLADKNNIFNAVVMIGQVFPCVYGVKSRAVEISDHSLDEPVTLTVDGNLAYKLDEEYTNKILVFFNLTSDSRKKIIAADRQSYFLILPIDCAQATEVREWAEKQGYLEPLAAGEYRHDGVDETWHDHFSDHNTDNNANTEFHPHQLSVQKHTAKKGKSARRHERKQDTTDESSNASEITMDDNPPANKAPETRKTRQRRAVEYCTDTAGSDTDFELIVHPPKITTKPKFSFKELPCRKNKDNYSCADTSHGEQSGLKIRTKGEAGICQPQKTADTRLPVPQKRQKRPTRP